MPLDMIMIWPLLRVVQVDCSVLFEVLPRLMKLEAPAISVVLTVTVQGIPVARVPHVEPRFTK